MKRRTPQRIHGATGTEARHEALSARAASKGCTGTGDDTVALTWRHTQGPVWSLFAAGSYVRCKFGRPEGCTADDAVGEER